MSVTFPSAVSGRVTSLPARDFDVTSGKGCPIIFCSIFTGSEPCFDVYCSSLMKLPPFN
jgi:hypothetical protein